MGALNNCTNCKKAKDVDAAASRMHEDCYACFPHAKTLGFYPHWEKMDNYREDSEEHPDMVNSPAHYTDGGIETIDFIEAKLGVLGFNSYCIGNAIKYLSRAGKKTIGGNTPYMEDVEKASWYLKRLLGEI